MRGHVRGFWEKSPEEVLNLRDWHLADDGGLESDPLPPPTEQEMDRAFTQYQQEHPE